MRAIVQQFLGELAMGLPSGKNRLLRKQDIYWRKLLWH